jgi:protein Tex
VSCAQRLFADGATIPFIARYRKEMTGGLDETQLAEIRDAGMAMAKRHARYATIIARLQEDRLLTSRLKHRLQEADTVAELDAIYAPYRRKRKTRADLAIERGLEPLARRLYDQQAQDLRPGRFVDPTRGVPDADSAMAGALDIVAAWIAERDDLRRRLASLFANRSILVAKVKRGKTETGAQFRDYFDYQEKASRLPSHRLLAILRGETKRILSVRIRPPDDQALNLIESSVIRSRGEIAKLMRKAAQDAWKRLLAPSLESAFRLGLKAKAEKEAIAIFAKNLRQLLLAAPAGQRAVLAIDPGFKSGCKAVALDRHGRVLEHCVLHLLGKVRDRATADVQRLCATHKIELIAVGSGTGGRECEAFVREQLPGATVVRVDESGASIYSASPIAKAEFPDLDITLRGAISIGRRLQDPLAELIKIDARSIGIGQYQHDVDQADLRRALDDTVVSCVNHVGVDLNRAGVSLLQYVSGVGAGLAATLVAHRDRHGPFRRRSDLLQVPRLGPKTFEQAAGFLRIPQGQEPLDATGVHPECHPALNRLARETCVKAGDFAALRAAASGTDLARYASDSVSAGTLQQAMNELATGARDPRGAWEQIHFSNEIRSIADLSPGMRLPGTVTNLTQFGAFVDLGVGQDGLIHISEMANHFVRDPSELLHLQQQVKVTVLNVDADRKRIGLSLRQS